jgi:protein O-GlcNAc transferase
MAMNPQIGFFLSSAIQYLQAGNLGMARKFLSQAKSLDSKNIDVLRLLGVLSAQEKKYDEALNFFNLVVKLAPKNGIAYSNIGNVYFELKDFSQALIAYNQSISLQPNYSEAFNNRGNTLQRLMQFHAAIENYDHAIRLDPSCAPYHANRANTLKELGLYDQALASYQQSLALNPNNDDAWVNLGNMFNSLKHYEDAVECFTNAIRINPKSPWALGSAIFSGACIFNYDNIESRLNELRNGIQQGLQVVAPHALLSLSDDEYLQRRSAEIWSQSWYPNPPRKFIQAKRSAKEKIRLAYFSADFRTHPVSQLSIGLFENHDKARFNVLGFSYGVDKPDEMTKRLEDSFDQFIDIRSMSDEEVANLAQELEIDIAIDLTGHTEHGRPGIFAHRAAPIQVNYLGFAGTMGTPYHDYIIANEVLIPAESAIHFSEKIAHLQGIYMTDDPHRLVSHSKISRSEVGLPEDSFAYCCFNNSYKINTSLVKCWANILRKVSKSVLWISANNQTFQNNLISEFAALGIHSDRIIFAPRVESASDHLARLGLADLFLDTIPYNAHTTAIDAIKAGLPILTIRGGAFAGRVASSLLESLGMPELIAQNIQDYEFKAVEISQQSEFIKQKMRAIFKTSSPLDPKIHAQNMEMLYTEMHSRQSMGLPLENIYNSK